MKRENWGSRFGFIMATAGFSIGLGNIWRFPYIMGQNGGGAFLLIYVLIAFLIALPLMTMEMGLGRKTQMTPIEGLKKLAPRSAWPSFGWIGMAASFLMMCYYVMLMAWVLMYGIRMASGVFESSGATAADHFQNVSSNLSEVLLFTFGIFVLVYAIIRRGLQKGVEWISKLFMPFLLILFVVLAIWANTLSGSFEGLMWYLKPDFSKVTGKTFLDAMGQAFYSIGVGMAVAFVFGSYLRPKTSDVPSNVGLIVICDTAIAFIAGLIIFPSLFALGLEPNAGFGLLFETMTSMFLTVPYGQLIGTVFYLLIFIAGLTSILSTVEAIVATTMESFKMSRNSALLINCGVLLALSVPNILSFSHWSDVRIFDFTIYGMFDFLSGNVFLPIAAFILSVYVAYVWKFSSFKEDVNEGATHLRIKDWWKIFVTYLIPPLIGIILINGLISSFW